MGSALTTENSADAAQRNNLGKSAIEDRINASRAAVGGRNKGLVGTTYVVARRDAPLGMAEQGGNCRVRIPLISSGAGERPAQVMGASILQSRPIEQPGDRLFELGATRIKLIGEHPGLRPAGQALEEGKGRGAQRPHGFSGLGGSEAQAMSTFVDLAPFEAARLFAAKPGEGEQLQSRSRRRLCGLLFR